MPYRKESTIITYTIDKIVSSRPDPSVIHVIPYNIFANKYQGSYKDVISRIRFFESETEYCQVLIEKDSPGAVLNAVSSTEHKLKRVLIEYSYFPKILKVIRRKYPSAFIAVRSINIEPLQHLDNCGLFSKRPFWVLYGIFRLFFADLFSKRYSDIIFSISEYEKKIYWDRIPGQAQVKWLPYFCPDYLLGNNASNNCNRKIVACLPTSQKNRKSWDLVTRFIKLAEAASVLSHDLQFVITGDLKDWGLPKSSHIKFMGMISDLRTFLPKVKAVAVLSPLGYGIKTTLIDAISNGCSAFVHPLLRFRFPDIVQQYLIPIDTNCLDNINTQFKNLSGIIPNTSINISLRDLNHSILKHDFIEECLV